MAFHISPARRLVILNIVIVACIIFWFISLFFGNPVSKFIAKRSIEKHIKHNYAGKQLEIQTIRFNFKDGLYWANVISKTNSENFYVASNASEVKYDEQQSKARDSYIQNTITNNAQKRITEALQSQIPEIQKIKLESLVEGRQKDYIEFRNVCIDIEQKRLPEQEFITKALDIKAVIENHKLRVNNYYINYYFKDEQGGFSIDVINEELEANNTELIKKIKSP